jgi:LPXTG-motif cell wall-anchored protein
LTLVSGAEGSRGAARGGALPFTGSDSLPLVWIALALLTVGTALVLAVRRRAQTRRSLSS